MFWLLVIVYIWTLTEWRRLSGLDSKCFSFPTLGESWFKVTEVWSLGEGGILLVFRKLSPLASSREIYSCLSSYKVADRSWEIYPQDLSPPRDPTSQQGRVRCWDLSSGLWGGHGHSDYADGFSWVGPFHYCPAWSMVGTNLSYTLHPQIYVTEIVCTFPT